MENYIIRIYRRDRLDPHKVNGTLESVEAQTRQSFETLDSLCELLQDTPSTRNQQQHTVSAIAK